MQKQFNNAVVAITGAGSGIGRALATSLAKEGARLALSDVDEAGLLATQSQCESSSSKVIIDTVDVSKRSQINQWVARVIEEFGSVNVVINNAGVNLSASVEEMTQKDFEWVMDIDFWGVVNGCRAFLPHLKAAEWGHIVNVSSLFGLIGIPNQSAYNSAKFAVRGFSESLRMEMELEGANVGVSCIHPGGVNTNIVNNARFGAQIGKAHSVEKQKKFFAEKLAKTSPESAAADIIKGIKNDSPRVLVGNDAKLLDVVQRVLPTYYQKLVLRTLAEK